MAKNGRPPKWENPEDLKNSIVKYFETCETDRKMPTKAGLRIALDTTMETLSEYSNNKGEEFSEAIKGAYDLIEEAWTQNLKGANATGSIFYLKAAFHFKDRLDVTSKEQGIALGELLDHID